MKVTFVYIPTEEGYKLETICEEIPTIPNSETYDPKAYLDCFEAIKKEVDNTITTQKTLQRDE